MKTNQLQKNIFLIGFMGSGKTSVSLQPVSYTHLDVYKRQSQCCAREHIIMLWPAITTGYRSRLWSW